MDGVQAGQDLDAQARRLRHRACKHEVVNAGKHRSHRPSCTCSWCAMATSRQATPRSTPPSPARRSTPKPRSTRRWSSRTSTTARPSFAKEAHNGYVAMVQHYFASAWLLADGIAARNCSCAKSSDNLYSVGMITALGNIDAGHEPRRWMPACSQARRSRTMLENLGPGLELVKDYGWLTILAKPLYWLLDQLHKRAGQLGLVHRGAGAAARRLPSTGSTPRPTPAWPR